MAKVLRDVGLNYILLNPAIPWFIALRVLSLLITGFHFCKLGSTRQQTKSYVLLFFIKIMLEEPRPIKDAVFCTEWWHTGTGESLAATVRGHFAVSSSHRCTPIIRSLLVNMKRAQTLSDPWDWTPQLFTRRKAFFSFSDASGFNLTHNFIILIWMCPNATQ